MTPGKAIRSKCVERVGSKYETAKCGGGKMIGQGDKDGVCYFFPYRQGRGRPSVKVIRKFCLECMGESRDLVRNCENEKCVLHPYRMGKNPACAGRPGPPRKQRGEQK